ncbi:hypothetical protein PC9H_007698 [Pleurotus ostreatus]|uniref:DH domain-containing protein n=1 Tax=Pleurotus ostreatus TaxID=5322 RepID=A0A8H6ZUL6_PLEOS|nr:uncharacterized protein PC9H_007698 [Pleurotus ostreatus]KAF7428474.1 hypothetical protein PC9H_007698 [Pleurotus ostreatus]
MQRAAGPSRPSHLLAPLSTPDTPDLTSSSSSGLFSPLSSDLDSGLCSTSPLSEMIANYRARGGYDKEITPGIWEPAFPSTPLFHLEPLDSFVHQHHVGDAGDDSLDADIYETLQVSAPPNSPVGMLPFNDSTASTLHRQRKPLPFLTQFMDASPIMKLFEEAEEAKSVSRDGVRPLAPIKLAFERDTFGDLNLTQSAASVETSELRVSSLSREERLRRVQSLKLHSPFAARDGPNSDSPTPSLTPSPSKNASLPRLNTELDHRKPQKPQFHLILSDDEASQSSRPPGAITLTLSSPIYSSRTPSSSVQYRRRWSVGCDEDSGLASPTSALLSPMSAALGTGFSSFSCDSPSPSPFHPLRPSLPSLSDPALMSTWQSARRAMLSCKEIARSERYYIASLRSLSSYEEGIPPALAQVVRSHAPSLIAASQSFVGALGRDSSSWGTANAFLINQDVIQSAFIACSEALHSLDIDAETAKSLRDAVELPVDRVARYIFLFQDILTHTPPTSSSWSTIQRALQSATRIARMCEDYPLERVPEFEDSDGDSL